MSGLPVSSGVFLDADTVDRGDVDMAPLQELLADWQVYPETTPEQAIERVRHADLVVSNKVLLDRSVLEAADRLRLICIAATGTNNVDLHAAAERGIVVCNVRDYATPSVVQHVFALILALNNRLVGYRDVVREGAWQRSPHFSLIQFPFSELAGKRLGIVGYGVLGRAVAETARCFGLEVLLAQRPSPDAPAQPDRIPLGDLLPQVDILSLHCPLTEATRGLIDTSALAAMGEDALLINAARGGIVDEAALADALRRGGIAGAGVDVLSEEPPVRGNPLLADDIPNLIVTPHVAWAARQARQRLIDQMAGTIRAFNAGRPQNRVA